MPGFIDPLPDAELLAGIAAGDRAAFAELFHRRQGQV